MSEPQMMIMMTPTMFREEVEAAVRRALEGGREAPPPELLTGAELCAKLRITRPTLRKYRELGMPSIKAGKGYRYRQADAERWLEARDE